MNASMNARQAIRSARAGFTALSVAVLVAGGCGQEEGVSFSSTLEAPAKPGDGYRLVSTSDDRDQINHISVSGNSLFFEVPWQGLFQMPKYGGDVTAVDRDTHAMFSGLASSGGELLWLKSHFDSHDYPDDFILWRPAAGGPTAVLRHADLNTVSINNWSSLTADASHVYLRTEDGLEVTPIGGGATELVAQSVWALGPGAVSFASDYPMVYKTHCEPDPLTCVLKSVDVPTGTEQVVGPISQSAQIVGLDAGSVYLLDGPRLWSLDRVDGAETELIGAAAGIRPGPPVALDGETVYFMGADPGEPAARLMAVSKSGGAATILGSDSRLAAYPWDMAVDDQFVFVLTGLSEVNARNEILAFPKTLAPAP